MSKKHRNRPSIPPGKPQQKGPPPTVAALQKELMELTEQEFAKAAELNALYGALQQAKRVHAEVSMLSSITELSYIGNYGKQQRVDLTDFEREARKKLEEQQQEPKVDADVVPQNQDLYGNA